MTKEIEVKKVAHNIPISTEQAIEEGLIEPPEDWVQPIYPKSRWSWRLRYKWWALRDRVGYWISYSKYTGGDDW